MFAGADFEKARYYPEDEKYLLKFEENVAHYETFEYLKKSIFSIKKLQISV